MEMLKVNKQDGEKGSQKPLPWPPELITCFHDLKTALADELELFHLEPDQPFQMRRRSFPVIPQFNLNYYNSS